MVTVKEYLLQNGTPMLLDSLKNSWLPNISYEYRLIRTYILNQPDRIISEMEYLIEQYEELLDMQRRIKEN